MPCMKKNVLSHTCELKYEHTYMCKGAHIHTLKRKAGLLRLYRDETQTTKVAQMAITFDFTIRQTLGYY